MTNKNKMPNHRGEMYENQQNKRYVCSSQRYAN